MTKTGVLVDRHEPQILRALRINLSVRGYEVITAASGRLALEGCRRAAPGRDRASISACLIWTASRCSAACTWLSAPVIVLWRAPTRREGRRTWMRVRMTTTKPFGMDEFLARLRAAVRRGAAASETDEPVIENRFLHSRSGREEGHQERCRGALDPHRVGHARDAGPQPRQVGRPRRAAQEVGDRRMRRRPTICGCTWPSCGASSKTIRRTRVICSPRPGWATASRRDPGGREQPQSGAHRFH